MQLKIKITGPRATNDSRDEYFFERFPIFVGRSPGNDVTLPDDNKYVSSKHAEIAYANNQFSLIDHSANGTFVNDSTTPVGRGNTIILSDNDTLTMGEFRLVVTVAQTSAAPPPPMSDPFGDIPSATPLSGDPSDPFAGLEDIASGNNSPLKVDNHIERLENIGIGPSAWDDDPNAAPADPFAHLNTPSAAADPLAPAPSAMGNSGAAATDDDDWAGWLGSIPTMPADKLDAPGAPSSNPPPASQPAAPSSPATPSPRVTGDDPIDLILKSAGLDPSGFSHVDRTQLAHHIGQILHKSTQSMMLLLRSRDEVKNAMRTDVTLLGSGSNNPLQFSISVEDALQKLLSPSGTEGFTDANKAIDKGLQDIKIHQLAMLEAMRSALQLALAHFDPVVLEKQTKEASPVASSLPLAKEAKLWEQFQSRYNDIKRETVDDFSDLFGKELRKAYEKSVLDLKGPS